MLSEQFTGGSFSSLERTERAAFKQWPASEGDCIKNSSYTQLPWAKLSFKKMASYAWFGGDRIMQRFQLGGKRGGPRPLFVPCSLMTSAR